MNTIGIILALLLCLIIAGMTATIFADMFDEIIKSILEILPPKESRKIRNKNFKNF